MAVNTATNDAAISELSTCLVQAFAESAVDDFPTSKRAFDVIVALLLLLFLIPVLIVVAALVAMDGGPIIFRQRRLGMSARPFGVLKFRTMCPDAEERLHDLLERDPAAAAYWAQYHKLRYDPRITRVGKFLRKSSLDELPQLLNVLNGTMSMVGPRPIVEAEAVRYRHHIRHYYRSRPGVTGLWQVSGRSDVSYRRRVAIDTLYARKPGRFSLDMRVIAMTIPAVLLGRGAF